MAILGSKNSDQKENSKEVFHYPTSKNALLIFTRNPELGKCKTRLAKTVGDEAALNIYEFLLQHTVAITTPLQVDKFVYYSVKVRENDVWDASIFRKKQQKGDDLGVRMQNAFTEVFEMGYERAIIIGSDMFDMTANDLQNAFSQLEQNDFVVGPAEDGGYYLLGMKTVKPSVFNNKTWGTETVLKDTLQDLKSEKVSILEEKNDIDYYEDVKDIEAFQQFLPIHLDNKID
ncbi:TIGR04282 family arsenosugar biosynthesis glycosyltransferase [Patiriisocius hiemis]|uniref:TIGR04282 family arsenosugar biosynthesis glycosyltransferase n=1 Tax=Patiriisocius hiemis TaxID=3075604 RepID=A0ABU2YE52_9FLAO|nr:TIGR04282 family arsenosugar biosynthesis glycosyltransferase [Constantimarinum sp. W242]MDT0556287.1 TIGR04282 family arsenosugar biosynthesis glycosyltransferase [Constantimarinum sp. W242]